MATPPIFSTKGQSKQLSDEELKFQFRGIWIPVEVFELMEEGVITCTEVMLLALIDSLVKSKGLGCWASNAWFAAKLHKHKIHISKLIRHLLDLKLIVIKNKYDPRLLETVWSRIGVSTSAKGGKRRCVGGVSTGAKEYIYSNNKKKERSQLISDEVATDLFSDNTPVKGFDLEMASRIWKMVASKGMRHSKSNLDKWANDIRLLRTEDNVKKKVIRQAIEWLDLHYGHIYTPQVACGKSFRSKFNSIVAKMNLKKNSEEEDFEELERQQRSWEYK